MIKLPDFQTGDKQRAADMETIVDALRELQEAVGLSQLPKGGISGQLLALMGQKDRFFLCKITNAPPAGVPILPSGCKYSYVSLDRKFTGEDVLPVYGRQVENDECAVYPDLVGRMCGILRNPQADGTVNAELWIFRENPVRRPCNLNATGDDSGTPFNLHELAAAVAALLKGTA